MSQGRRLPPRKASVEPNTHWPAPESTKIGDWFDDAGGAAIQAEVLAPEVPKPGMRSAGTVAG